MKIFRALDYVLIDFGGFELGWKVFEIFESTAGKG